MRITRFQWVHKAVQRDKSGLCATSIILYAGLGGTAYQIWYMFEFICYRKAARQHMVLFLDAAHNVVHIFHVLSLIPHECTLRISPYWFSFIICATTISASKRIRATLGNFVGVGQYKWIFDEHCMPSISHKSERRLIVGFFLEFIGSIHVKSTETFSHILQCQ